MDCFGLFLHLLDEFRLGCVFFRDRQALAGMKITRLIDQVILSGDDLF